MREALPLAYKAYHGIFKTTKTGTGEEVSRNVWRLAGACRKVGGKCESSGQDAGSNENISGNGQTPKLVRLHKRIAEIFEADPNGSKVFFSRSSTDERLIPVSKRKCSRP